MSGTKPAQDGDTLGYREIETDLLVKSFRDLLELKGRDEDCCYFVSIAVKISENDERERERESIAERGVERRSSLPKIQKWPLFCFF